MEFNNTKRRKPSELPNMMFGKVPPQAKELEEAVLGAIMLEKGAFDKVAETLTVDCFYSEANQRVFKSMCDLVNKNQPIDLLTVVQQLKDNEDLEIAGGPYYLSKLTNSVVSSANINAHANIVLKKFIGREMIRVAGEMLNGAYDDGVDVYDLLGTSEKDILTLGINHNTNGDMIPIAAVLKEAFDKIEEWGKSDGSVTGVPTPFPELDQATRGWQPGDLIVLGARPSVGKTAMALNIARSAAGNNYKPITTAIWSLEMKAVYLAIRLLAAESEIYMHRLQTGKLDEHHMQRLIKSGFDILSQMPIFFDDGSKINLRTLSTKARRLKKKNKLGLIIIDYLQLMSGEDNKGNREQEISKISRGLKELAQELDVPIIALSQLSRQSEDKVTWENGPTINSLRESGAIEQDADVIMLLWGPSEGEVLNDAGLEGRRKLKIAKQRNGVLKTIELDFRNEIQLFAAIGESVGQPLTPVKNLPQYKNNDDDQAPF